MDFRATVDYSSSDSEEEEQDEPSSSPTNEDVVDTVVDAVNNLDIKEEQKLSPQEELAAFRQQWKRELETSPTCYEEEGEPPKEKEKPVEDTVSASDEERAKKIFLRAIELERSGKLYEAVGFYKRAIQIVPDIEARLYRSTNEGKADDTEEEEPPVEVKPTSPSDEEDDEDAVEGEDLIARLTRIQAKKGVLCVPETEMRETHISCLPYELVLLISRWVVSADLDTTSLERLGSVCRGLYLVARDTDIWRTICIRTWGMECGIPRALGFSSWRHMYVERARLQLNGCYISKTKYLRWGEDSFQDQYYRPWYIIKYYRYLRFFQDGRVLMWTTPDKPAACVGQLRARTPRAGLGILAGHYRLIGDKVVILVKKVCEKKPAQPSNTRFKPRIKEPEQEKQTRFRLELQLRTLKSRRNVQLSWLSYAISAPSNVWSSFDLTPAAYPPFLFSIVRHYSHHAYAPLTR